MMDSMTLSQRFAGCRIDDTEAMDGDGDLDLIAMRQKYLKHENASTSNLSKSGRGKDIAEDASNSDEDLKIDGEWRDHFLKLTEKCESLTSDVCFTYLYGENGLADDIVHISGDRSGDRSDHDENVYDDIAECDDNDGWSKDFIADSNSDDLPKSTSNDSVPHSDSRPNSRIPDSNSDIQPKSVQDTNLPVAGYDSVPHSNGWLKSNIPGSISESRTVKSVQGTPLPATIIIEGRPKSVQDSPKPASPKPGASPVVPGKVYASKTLKGCNGTVTYELTNTDTTELGVDNKVVQSANSTSSGTEKSTPITNGNTSQLLDEATIVSENTKVSTSEETHRSKATKGKAVEKKKVMKKFDIKPASSFPLDELLPPVGKSASKITDDAKNTNVKEGGDQIDTNSDKNKGKDWTKHHFTESDVFHGSVFDYSSSDESDVGDQKPDINTDSINTTSSFINSGIVPDQSYLSNYGTPPQMNSHMHGYSENVNNNCFGANVSEFDSPVYTSVSSGGPMNEFNMSTATSSDPNVLSMNFFNERNRMIQNTLDEIGEFHSIEQCESLLNVLNAQCSVLAATDEDRMKLNIMIHALRSKIMDASLASSTPDLTPSMVPHTPDHAPSTAPHIDLVPSFALDTFAGLTPTEATYEDNIGPGGDSMNEMENELFEGRTLLKGGVEPRRIPKTTVNKHLKGRPIDPRLASISTYRKLPVKLRLPKFSVDLYGEKTVKKMIHLDWEAYFASNKGKNLKGKDPRLSDIKGGSCDIDPTGSNRVSSPAPESMNYSLGTGNINISVQQSFLGLGATNMDVGSDVLAKLRDIDSLNALHTPDNKMECNSSSSDVKNSKSKTETELHQNFWNPKSMCVTPMEITQPLSSNTSIQPVAMDLDDDLEEGQVQTTDSDGLSDVSSVRNGGVSDVSSVRNGGLSDVSSVKKSSLGATDWHPTHADVSMKITIPNTDFQKKEKSSTRVYRPRHSSKGSVASSSSVDSRSVRSSKMESGQRGESVKRDKSSERLKHGEHFDASGFQSLDYYINKQTDLSRSKEHNQSNHSKSRQRYKDLDNPQLSEKHQTQSSRRRHQTSRDTVLPHNVRPELAQAMKRHHSLEEVNRKRHKSGDLISDGRNNDTVIDLTAEDTSDQHVKLIHPNQPYVKQQPKKSVHERLGRKHNQPYSKPIQNVNERVGPHRTQNVHEQTGHLHTQNVHEQSSHHRTKSVHDRVGPHRTQNVHEQSGHNRAKSVHDRVGPHRTQNVHEKSGHNRTHSGSSQSKISPVGLEKYPKHSGQPNVHDRLGQHNVHNRLGQLHIHEQSGNKTISTQRQQISYHQYEMPNPSSSQQTNNSTRQMHDDEIAKEYQQKFESSKNNPDQPKPADKISVVRRRKSLEEQELELEQDKQFLLDFKMKINKK